MIKKNIKKKIKKTFIYKIYCFLLKEKIENRRVKRATNELQVQGADIVKKISIYLNNENAQFFVNFGSLLGLIRDQHFITYDHDMDFGIIINKNFGWKNLEKAMIKCGAMKLKQFTIGAEITEQSYRIGHIDIDFFKYSIEDDGAHEYLFYKDEKETYLHQDLYSAAKWNVFKISGIKQVDINGEIYNIPNEPEEYLASIYTQNWRIPDPNWDPIKAPSLYKLKDTYGRVEFFV